MWLVGTVGWPCTASAHALRAGFVTYALRKACTRSDRPETLSTAPLADLLAAEGLEAGNVEEPRSPAWKGGGMGGTHRSKYRS